MPINLSANGILHNYIYESCIKGFGNPLPNVHISANGFLTVGCLLVWFHFVCVVCVCACMHAYVHVDSHLWSLDEGTGTQG